MCQDHPTSQSVRRHTLSLWGLVFVIGAFVSGCQTDPRARREIALLRSEMVALEDRYYALKNRYEGDETPGTWNDGMSPDGLYIEEGQGALQSGATQNTDPRWNEPTQRSGNSILNDRKVDPQAPQEELKLELDEGPTPTPEIPKGGGNGLSASRNRPRNNSLQAARANRSQKDLAFRLAPRDADDNQIDDGMEIEIEFEPGHPPQDVHVSLLDPQLPNGSQRIGNWRFGKEALRRMPMTDSTLTLQIPWDRKPKNPSLLVFVRSTDQEKTQEGSQSLLANLDGAQDAEIIASDPELTPSGRMANAPPEPNQPGRWRPNR